MRNLHQKACVAAVKSSGAFFMVISFYRRHCPDIGQEPQLPQLQTIDLPLRFFLTMLIIIAATTPTSTAQMMIVQMLFKSHVNINSTSLLDFDILCQPV